MAKPTTFDEQMARNAVASEGRDMPYIDAVIAAFCSSCDEPNAAEQAIAFDQSLERSGWSIVRTDTIKELRGALNEVTTNGQWTNGEQLGDWAISKEVYETARDALDITEPSPST